MGERRSSFKGLVSAVPCLPISPLVRDGAKSLHLDGALGG